MCKMLILRPILSTNVGSRVRGLHFGLGLDLPPYLVYVSSEGSGKSEQLRRHA